MKDYANYNLQKHNTFGIDVQCQRFVEYNSIEEAQALVRLLTPADEPILILGGGSNLLLTKDYKGTVIHSGIKFLKQLDDEHVQCGSGFGWDDFVDFCCNHQLYGAPPHAGLAFGLDRFVSIMAGLDSIRDCIAFPKNNSGRDVMLDAPSALDPKQLDELQIKLDLKA